MSGGGRESEVLLSGESETTMVMMKSKLGKKHVFFHVYEDLIMVLW